jgi:WD40 repeat protein/serine/threonine protein kinase
MSEGPSEFDPVEELADSFLARYRRGERPSLSEYARQHPELAEQIRELFPALVVIEELGSVEADSTAGRDTGFSEGSSVRRQLGEYQILREIGRGGMGVVYEAVQESLGRHVALKVLPFHGLLNPAHLERFRREARAVARLHHTNIVPVFGVGEHEGIAYYAMQFILGQGIHEVLQEVRRLRACKSGCAPPQRLLAASVAESLVSGQFARSGVRSQGSGIRVSPTPDPSPLIPETLSSHSHITAQPEAQYFHSIAQIALQVAEALEYAHGEGVLHRDIKPSNLLLDTRGRVWVTDFGLAKADETEDLTDPGDIVGTLSYMAPERFQGKADGRSDVYGLGITLYELATLQPAFTDSRRARLIEKVTRDEPRRPRKLDHKIPRDLETIVLKAIAKDANQRYATAGAMAQDLRRFLSDRPIQARRATLGERAWRWCRRNPMVAALSTAVVVFVITTAVVASVSAVWLRQEAARARQAEHDATEKLWQSYYAQAQASRWSGRAGQRFESLKALAAAAQIVKSLVGDNNQLLTLRNEAIACLPLADVRPAMQWDGYTPGTTAFTFDARLERYALSDRQGTIRICRVNDAQEIARLPGSGKPATDLRFSPNGRFLAVTDNGKNIEIWDVGDCRRLFRTPVAASDACLDWSRDSRWVAVGLCDHFIGAYDVPSGRELIRLAATVPGNRLAIDPPSSHVAISGWTSNDVQVRDLATGTVVHEFKHPRVVDGLCWSPDGRYLACGCQDNNIYLWDLIGNTPRGGFAQERGRDHWASDMRSLFAQYLGVSSAFLGNAPRRLVLRGHQMAVQHVAFNHDGDMLASQSLDGTLRLWDPATGKQLVSIPGAALAPQFSTDDRLLSGTVQGSQIALLEVAARRECCLLRNEDSGPAWQWGLDFSPDGRLLASAGDTGIQLWDLADSKNMVRLDPGRYGCILFQRDGSGLVGWGDSELRRWPIQTEVPPGDASATAATYTYIRISNPLSLYHSGKLGTCRRACWGPDGRSLVLADRGNNQAVLLDLDGPGNKVRFLEHSDISYVALSPDGNWLATSGQRGSGVKIWNARNAQRLIDLLAEEACVAFSPDSRWLVTGTSREYCFWQTGSWHPAFRIPRADATLPGCLAFTDAGRTLAFSSSDRTIQLFDLETRTQLATLAASEPQMILALAFSRDGAHLAAATQDNLIQLWNLGRVQEEFATVGLDWGRNLSPDAKEDRRPVRFAKAPSESFERLEAEDLPIVGSADCFARKQDMTQWEHTKWSGGYQLFGGTDRAGAFVTLEVDLPRAGTYHVDIYFTKAPDYGILEVSLDGKKIGQRYDGYDRRVIPAGRLGFGDLKLAKGPHQIRFTVASKNPASTNYCMGIDCLEFKLVK